MVFSLIILAVLFFTMDFGDFSKLSINWDYQLLLLMLVWVFVSFLLRAIRWQILMDDGLRLTLKSIINSTKFLLVGSALNIVMPSGAGDIAKSYFGYKWTGVKERMFSVSLVDKMIAVASLSIMSIYSIFQTKNPWFVLAAFVVSMPLLVAFYGERLPFIPRFIAFLSTKIKKVDLKEVMSNLKFKTSTTVWSFAISLVGWVTTYLVLYYCFVAVGFGVELGKVLAMAPILTIGRLFPLTFNGVGSDEVLIVYVFSQDGVHDEKILVAALLYRILMMILPAIIGAYYLLSIKKMDVYQSPMEK